MSFRTLGGRQSLPLAELSAVVQRVLVSPSVAAIALEQAGYIDRDTKLQWKGFSSAALAARFGWIDQYHALQAESDRRRAPQRLLACAVNGYALVVLSARAIAMLRGIPLEEAKADLREAGVEQAEPTPPWADTTDLPDVASTLNNTLPTASVGSYADPLP